ncbi:MAG: DUF1385 domain-containing protein [Clostridiales bacterium]|nr:DUF1385 domain-containing protein [Clostridiales bacterium]
MSERKAHKTAVGGQALMEGVMMLGPKGMATAIRKPDGEILTEVSELKRIKDKHKFLGWPVIRGIVNFVESMKIGYKALMHSAEVAFPDGEEEEMSDFEKKFKSKFGDKIFSFFSMLAGVLGICLAFFLFSYLPVLAFNKVNEWSGGAITDFQGLIEGVLKIIIFVIYLAIISSMKDMKRVFMYHGAEHKTIACYESGEELTVENVKKCTRFHPRCGTSFIFVILILSIIIYTIVAKIFPAIAAVRLLWIFLKILFLPLIMGAGYEFIQYAGRHENAFVKIASEPGLWMQRLTTREPTDDIIEVGIESLKAVITGNPEDDEIK